MVWFEWLWWMPLLKICSSVGLGAEGSDPLPCTNLMDDVALDKWHLLRDNSVRLWSARLVKLRMKWPSISGHVSLSAIGYMLSGSMLLLTMSWWLVRNL